MPRPSPPSETPLYRYRFGTAEFDEARLELHVGGLIVDMERKPLLVLARLLSRCDEPVSRADLLENAWGGRPTVDNVLSNAILKLRKALGDDANERIVTVSRLGYKLVGPVDRMAVGRRLLSRLQLAAGAAVPGREHYRLDALIGATRGNEVWLARHYQTRETRVFKISPDGERLSELKREATIYRLLQESLGERIDFVRIFDWNFETQPFYLECEYGGENLTAWAADNRLDALTLPERLRLFLQIAEAVSAAHSVGVLHKDLKPANILITDGQDGIRELRVADFGSGWLLEPDRLADLGITQHGLAQTQDDSGDSSTGTPMYVAPEIFAGHKPTVQSDLYALGIVLYQIVVADLRRPMAAGWESTVADDILCEDIAAATDGQPSRRLASVSELVTRLRCLEERRVQKRLARAAELRLATAIKVEERTRARRPWLVAAMASLALGLAVSLMLYQRQKQARLDAERETSVAEQINRFLSEDLLGAADPSGPGGAHNPTMRDVLNGTAERLASSAITDPETKASIDSALANAHFGMTDYVQAEKYRRASVELLTTARGPGDTKTLEADYALASLLVQTNRLDAAKDLLESADHLAGARLTQHSELALKAHWSHAGYYKLRMLPAQALDEYAAAEAVRVSIEPANASLMFRLRDALSWCYSRLNRDAEAAQMLQDIVTPDYPPERVGPSFWAQGRIDYGVALKVLGRNDESEAVMTDALAEIRRSLGPDHFLVALVQNELGDLYTREHLWPKAVSSLREAYAILRQRSGEHGQATLIVAANLGIVEFRTGDSIQAVRDLTTAHDDLARQLGTGSPQAESVAYYLAWALADSHRYQDAAQLMPPLTVTDLAAAEPRSDWQPRLDALHGEILIGQGQRPDGIAKLTHAIAQMVKMNTPAEDSAPFRKLLASQN